MHKTLLSFLAFIATAMPTMATDAARYFGAEYRLYVSGLLIGKANVRLIISSNNYLLSAHIRPAGFGRIAGQSHVVSTTRGALREGQLVPQRLDLSWTMEGTIKSSYMDYIDGAPHKFVSGYAQSEEFRPKNPIAIEAVGTGSVDPFLGLLLPLNGQPLRAACDGTKRIFDGRRLARLIAQDAQFVPPFEHDFPQRRPAVKCSILWQPVAGYSEASFQRASEFPPVRAHFGQIGDIGFAAPLDMRGKSRYGRITIYAVEYFTETTTPFAPFDIRKIVKKR